LTYSFGQALVSDALRTWKGIGDQVEAAQTLLLENSRRASEASHRSMHAGASS